MKPYLKAIVGLLVAGTGSLAVAAVDNSIVLGEWMAALATAVAAGGAVFGVPNDPRPRHIPDPGNQPIT